MNHIRCNFLYHIFRWTLCKFIHIVVCTTVRSLSSPYVILLCAYVSPCSLGACVDCYSSLWLWSNAAENILVHHSWYFLCILFTWMCASERSWWLLWHIDVQLEWVSNYRPESSPESSYQLALLPAVWVPATLASPPLSTACFCFVLVALMGRYCCLIVGLAWIPLTTTEVEQLLVFFGHLRVAVSWSLLYEVDISSLIY